MSIMDSSKLTLVKVEKDPLPAVFRERAAARYLDLGRDKFRELVRTGAIPFSFHVNGKHRIFLRSELDGYLLGLKQHRMGGRESLLAALDEKKGVAK